MMDIKTRIDGLTELEAKAALRQCIKTMGKNIHCGDCRYSEILPDGTIGKCATPWNCVNMLLDDALKGAETWT